MPVPQRVNFFIVGWASCPPEQARCPPHKKLIQLWAVASSPPKNKLKVNNMQLDKMRQREQKTGWILVAPALIILMLVFAYPILRAFWLSLFTQNLGTELKLFFPVWLTTVEC